MNAEQIKVYDGLIPLSIQKELAGYVEAPIWQYGWGSYTGTPYRHWHVHFAGGDKDCMVSCEPELLSSAHDPMIKLWEVLSHSSGPLVGFEPTRVYGNGHTYGTEGYVHVDCCEDQQGYTILYYANREWGPNWAGETVFYTEDRLTILKSVNPVPGRVVMFPGHIPHRAHSPSRNCPELRVSLVFKIQEKK